MTTKDQPRRVPIPTPAEFPVEWEQADDAEQTWNRDTHHRPDAIPELEADFWDQSGSGWLYTDKILATEPISHQEYRCINGYLYSYNRLLVAEDQQEAVKERNKAPMTKAIDLIILSAGGAGHATKRARGSPARLFARCKHETV